jgi:hypothetical protein
MAQLDVPGGSALSGALADGLNVLDLESEVNFQVYTRVVLPIDKFVYWTPSVCICVKGSLHFTQEIQQSEDETINVATVTFTSLSPVLQFVNAPINAIFVATVAGFRYAFHAQQGFYNPAKLWHYIGASINPAMETQLLDDPSSIDPTQAVTSNSLSLWLALNTYAPLYYDWFQGTGLTLYPADLVSPNLVPPYGVVDVQSTTAVQATPYLDENRNHYQLMADRVKVTIYGTQNNAALDFIDCVNQYSVNSANFGITNMPAMQDEKRTQTELQAIAMKKSASFEISYNQIRVAQVSRQLILSAVPTVIIATN